MKALLHSTGFVVGFVMQWVAVLACFGAFAFGCIYFGNKLERAAQSYAEAERMEALESLYSSTNWAAKVESANDKRLRAEKKLEMVCKKTRSKVCL